MIDSHSHCDFSHDGQATAEQMICHAIDKQLDYYAITDHCDFDCLNLPAFSWVRQLDVENRFKTMCLLKEKYQDKIEFAIGIECGYLESANKLYEEMLKKYPTDIIINSVHLVEEEDVYYKSYFDKRGKFNSYAAYFKAVRKSLDVSYPYDVIGHIGYIARKAPFEDKSFGLEFNDMIDDILETIISKGKALEINTNGKGTGNDFIPPKKLIKRFLELGGEFLSFGSDAHWPDRIADKYQLVTDYLRSIGVKHLFKYINHKPIPVNF